MSRINVPVSVGELIDKMTILEIKTARITDCGKLDNIRSELAVLDRTWTESESGLPDLSDARSQLKSVNEQLWDIEDKLRQLESKHCFDDEFIELARAVYTTNDLRSKIKKEINQRTGSEFSEEKSYPDYG